MKIWNTRNRLDN